MTVNKDVKPVKNHWLDEIRIREAAAMLQGLLTDEFAKTYPDPAAWLETVEDLLDMLYADDPVVLDGLMRYEIECTIDELGLVEEIRLVERA